MNHVNMRHWEEAHSNAIPDAKSFIREATELCEKALNDARSQLHPLLRNMDINHLDGRREFVRAFRSALERRIAKRLVLWQPTVQAVFTFDETRVVDDTKWDNIIHLLAKIPRLSDGLRLFGKKLDMHLLGYLQQMGWSRFKERRSILDLQQVTLNELRHGISYGAMFHAVYNVPVRIWPSKK